MNTLIKLRVSAEFTEKLDPCPFCGGKAAATFYGRSFTSEDGTLDVTPVIEIGCTNCPATMSLTDDLVKKWNARKKVDGRSKKK